MAMGDYRLCDVCGKKAFYDANLNYEDPRNMQDIDRVAFRVAGVEQYDNLDLVHKYGARLDYVGDWAVICTDCSPKFKTKIIPVDE